MEPSGAAAAARLHHEFGVTFDPEWKGWFDIFCCELLKAWFEQHAVLEAQMAHVFDAFDKDGSGTLEFGEFTKLIDKSPMANKYSEQQLMHMFSELTAQDGLLTKHDWTNLFHHVQFDVLTMIRPRRGSMRRMLVRDVSMRGEALIPDSQSSIENSSNGGFGEFGGLEDLEPIQITRSM